MFKYLILFFLFFCQFSFACKCSIPTAEMAMDEADEIFVGNLLKIDTVNKQYFGTLESFIKYTFQVKKSWKSKQNKIIEVTSLSRCSKLTDKIGNDYLIVAYKYEDTLRLACGAKDLNRKSFGIKERISDKYQVSLQEEFDHISNIPKELFSKIIDGGISIQVLSINQEESENLYYNYPQFYSSVYIDKGSNAGLYKGIDFCRYLDDKWKFLTVYEVHETYALAISTVSNSENSAQVSEQYKSCMLLR